MSFRMIGIFSLVSLSRRMTLNLNHCSKLTVRLIFSELKIYFYGHTVDSVYHSS